MISKLGRVAAHTPGKVPNRKPPARCNPTVTIAP
jgi:hypothetical protein